ncbi:unnamed protein product [Pleuronectes platessa]|uniref:Uncharacterized protein n=1 Tax=Pleuronectes platessa TaxID=8262 RepID=A0A9N7TVU0_PLEPL|nr:unnamed protein product [Pleuronectes platessa]
MIFKSCELCNTALTGPTLRQHIKGDTTDIEMDYREITPLCSTSSSPFCVLPCPHLLWSNAKFTRGWTGCPDCRKLQELNDSFVRYCHTDTEAFLSDIDRSLSSSRRVFQQLERKSVSEPQDNDWDRIQSQVRHTLRKDQEPFVSLNVAL